MASKNDKIIVKKAKLFNKKRKKLLPTGIRCQLLEKAGFSGDYRVLLEVEDWWHTYDNYRLQTIVQVATQSEAFQTAFNRASDVKIGNSIFEIIKRDSKPPDGKRPYWELRGKTDIELE